MEPNFVLMKASRRNPRRVCGNPTLYPGQPQQPDWLDCGAKATGQTHYGTSVGLRTFPNKLVDGPLQIEAHIDCSERAAFRAIRRCGISKARMFDADTAGDSIR